MNLPLRVCWTAPGSHFIPLKRQIWHCDSSYHSPESGFTQLMKDGAAASSRIATLHWSMQCLHCLHFLTPLQPSITGRTSSSPTVRCQWFQFCSSTTETTDATSKTFLHSKQTHTQVMPRKETQTRHRWWQTEEDDILRSQSGHQPFLHWKFLPLIRLHKGPSLTVFLVHLGLSNIKKYSVCCEITLFICSRDLDAMCHCAGPLQAWPHHSFKAKTSSSANTRLCRREAWLFTEKNNRPLPDILTFSLLPQPTIISAVKVLTWTKTYPWPGLTSLGLAWTTVRFWLPVTGKPWLLTNLPEARAKPINSCRACCNIHHLQKLST